MMSSEAVSLPDVDRSGVPASSRPAAAVIAARSERRSRRLRVIVVLLDLDADGAGLLVSLDDRVSLRGVGGGAVTDRAGGQRVGGQFLQGGEFQHQFQTLDREVFHPGAVGAARVVQRHLGADMTVLQGAGDHPAGRRAMNQARVRLLSALVVYTGTRVAIGWGGFSSCVRGGRGRACCIMARSSTRPGLVASAVAGRVAAPPPRPARREDAINIG